jgi:hypothetical protein
VVIVAKKNGASTNWVDAPFVERGALTFGV